MRKIAFTDKKLIGLFLILLSGACESEVLNGLHNSSKTFTEPQHMLSEDWSDPAEMERTWQAALVRIPDSSGSIIKSQIKKLGSNSVPERLSLPTVIYLHGCSGIWSGTLRRIDFLSENGFAVIAPASFARNRYPQSCDPDSHKGGMYRATLRMRQNDAGYAIEKARALPWVDSRNLFLVGLSQGGITTATFSSSGKAKRINARIIEGWTCHAGWDEYRGINTPKSEPVLSLVGENDPWFQAEYLRGDCGRYMSKTNGSRSVVYRKEPLRNQHALMESEAVQKITLEFLRRHIK